MNILFSCIGRRTYMVEYFRKVLPKGSKIIGTSNTKYTPGFHYSDRNYLVPDIKDEEDYVSTLLEICEENEIKLLLSFLDLDTHTLSKYKETFLEKGVYPLLPDKEESDICFDKLKTYEFCKKNKLNVPKTYGDIDLSRRAIDAGTISFPIFVKPRFGFGSKNLFIANNLRELETFYYYDDKMIIQEKLQGYEYSFDILSDINTNVVSVCMKKKVKMRFGETDQAITFHNHDLYDFALHLAKKLNHKGVLDIDFFMVGEIPYLLELNPRFGGGYPISQLAGANFPSLIVKLVKEGYVSRTEYPSYRSDIFMMKDIKILSEIPNNIQKKITSDG